MPKEERMTEIGNREDRLRRECKKQGIALKKTRRRGPGSEHGPYHVIEPIGNLAVSAVPYPNGMTLEEAEAFVEQGQG
jgi:hypothetical protein